MQCAIAKILSTPWAVLPDRLPFIRAALASAARHTPEPQEAPCLVRTEATISATRRQPGNTSVIAVLPFYGVAVQRADAVGEAFGLLSLGRFTQAFRTALADHAVGAILIDIDSPGGSAYGVAELADEIYRGRARKPIAAIANSLAASGAYWVASAADEFYVTPPGGEVGSIGVVTAHQDVSKALRTAGVETTLISAGKHKTEGNPFEPLGPTRNSKEANSLCNESNDLSLASNVATTRKCHCIRPKSRANPGPCAALLARHRDGKHDGSCRSGRIVRLQPEMLNT